jgi:membrane protein
MPAGIPESVRRRDPKTIPTGIQATVETSVKEVTDNRIISRVLAVLNIAGEAGAPLFSAALAFSTMFAVIPLFLLLAGVIGLLIENPAEQQALLDQLISMVPPLADFFEATLTGLVQNSGALSLVGIVGLLWGASAYYAGLDEVMRRIFIGGGVRDQFARRIRGVITIVVLIALVMLLVALGSVWALLERFVADGAVWRYVVPLISIAATVVVVLGVYKLVPTAPPSLRAALPPAMIAGVGIALLTNLFGALTPLFLGSLSGLGVIATVFGALIWLNFSYQILLYGAAWARLRRDREADRASVVSLPPD